MDANSWTENDPSNDPGSANGTSSNLSTTAVPFLPDRYIPYIAWLTLMAVIGTFGNLLIILSLVIEKKLRTISNVFVVNLAFADIFVTTIIDPFSVIAVFNEGALFYRHEGLCVFAGAFVVTCCATSIWTITAISVERYIHLCHPFMYYTLFNRRTAPMILTCLWVIGFSIALPYFEGLGWGSYGYSPKGRICTCIFNVNYDYSWYLIGFELLLPMIIIPICYMRINLYVRRSRKRITRTSATIHNEEGQKADIRVLKMLATVWLVFMIMWSPYTANVLFDRDTAWPDLFFMTAVAFCLSNSSINFIIYGAINKIFRKAYVKILNKSATCFQTCFVIVFVKNTQDSRKSKTLCGRDLATMSRTRGREAKTVHKIQVQSQQSPKD